MFADLNLAGNKRHLARYFNRQRFRVVAYKEVIAGILVFFCFFIFALVFCEK